MTLESKDEEITLAQGPFMRKEEDEKTQLQETGKELRELEKSGKLNPMYPASF